MPAIVEFPTVVQQAMRDYTGCFANEPERRHFAEYLTGLLLADRKTVRGINSEFVQTTDQSSLNRFLTQACAGEEPNWDVQKLNDRRLELLQRDPDTRYCDSGVIPIDNVLIDHEGKLIEDVGWFWDHADKRHLIAHDYLIVNYVCPSGKHYPLDFRRFRKKEQCDPNEHPFRDHNELARDLVDWVCQREIPGDFSFDCYFTTAENLNHIQGKGRGYVADLKFNRKLLWQGQTVKASEFAKTIAQEDRKLVEIGERRQWYFTVTLRIPEVDHRVRLVILWNHKNDPEPVKMMLTNRVGWEITKILRVYRKRWTGTETFHRDGKQHLGMGDCQLRSGQGQTAHMYLVFVAYSVLMRQLRQGRAREWALAKLTTIGEACRAALRETLGKTIDWALGRAMQGWTREEIKVHLALG